MSKIEVNTVEPQCGTTLTLGASGDTITIPAGATITNNGTQTGFGRTGTVNWQTGSIKTSTFTAVNGQGFFVDTNGGAVTSNLPAGSAGAIVSFQDYRNTFDTHSLTITPNGSEKINGGSGSIVLNTEGEGATLVYIDGTVGWRSIQDNTFADVGSNFISASGGTETTSGDCKIHTFTGPGTFTVSSAAQCAANNVVSYAVVAGGGAGGSGYQTGGGGAGGFREYKSPVTPYTASPLDGNPGGTSITVTATAFPITVGAGGAVNPASPGCGQKGSNGANSIFSTVTSTGGGGGAAYNQVCGPIQNGNPGGSGGGGGRRNKNSPGGSGNTPPVSPAQGKDGGAANQPYGHPYSGGGGGGATTGGTNSTGSTVGTAGNGATTSISGSPTAYAGGGGGGGYGSPAPSSDTGDSGNGGTGGGGKGGYGGPGQPTSTGVAGSVNTGGGGGGSSFESELGGAGGSGIVIIRYKFQQVNYDKYN